MQTQLSCPEGSASTLDSLDARARRARRCAAVPACRPCSYNGARKDQARRTGGRSMNDDAGRGTGPDRAAVAGPRRGPHRRAARILPLRCRSRGARADRRALGEAARHGALSRAADHRHLRGARAQRLALGRLRTRLAGARPALRQAELRLLRRDRHRPPRSPRSGARSSSSPAPRPTSACCSPCSRWLQRGHEVFLLEDCVASSEPHTRPARKRMYAAGVDPVHAQGGLLRADVDRDRLPRPALGRPRMGAAQARVRRAREPGRSGARRPSRDARPLP